MIHFERDKLDYFLGVIRKYMHLRGGLSQKDLAEMTDTGISTMSRFLNQKTKDLDAQLIAKLVAKLEIPLHEVIDFINENSTAKFKKLVMFYKDDENAEELGGSGLDADEASALGGGDDFEDAMGDIFENTKMRTQTDIKIGGRSTTMSFGGEERRKNQPLREKLQTLSPRQKAYLSDFLDLDMEGRDLIVDIGNSLLRYFKQRGVEL